jgi:hypothetical protein
MSLVPLIQPPLMKMMTTEKERQINMSELSTTTPASKTTKIVFPIVVTIFGGLIAPMGLPLLATIMLGNLLKESGAGRPERRAEIQQIQFPAHARGGRQHRRPGRLGHGRGHHALGAEGDGDYSVG